MAPTLGECKGGMALSYKAILGYAPLVLSLTNTNEVLYLIDPRQCSKPEGCVPWSVAVPWTREGGGLALLLGALAMLLCHEMPDGGGGC